MVNRKLRTKPIIGDASRTRKMVATLFQFTMENPLATTKAPKRPPIKAWEELVGIPKYQVNRFQLIAAIKAAKTIMMPLGITLIISGLTISFPIVRATAVPRKYAPVNSNREAITSAQMGDIAREETIVATIFEES